MIQIPRRIKEERCSLMIIMLYNLNVIFYSVVFYFVVKNN